MVVKLLQHLRAWINLTYLVRFPAEAFYINDPAGAPPRANVIRKPHTLPALFLTLRTHWNVALNTQTCSAARKPTQPRFDLLALLIRGFLIYLSKSYCHTWTVQNIESRDKFLPKLYIKTPSRALSRKFKVKGVIPIRNWAARTTDYLNLRTGSAYY